MVPTRMSPCVLDPSESTPGVPPISGRADILDLQSFHLQREATTTGSALCSILTGWLSRKQFPKPGNQFEFAETQPPVAVDCHRGSSVCSSLHPHLT